MTAPDSTHRRARIAEWLVAILWLAAVVAATMQQGIAHQNNNFLIFRAASQHLLAGADLYAAYPAQHADFYKYSPTFALLFVPFALLPFGLAMLAWNALNAGTLYVAPGTAASVIGAAVKVFPLAALSFAVFHPRKVRVALATAASIGVLALLPLLVTSPETLAMQYEGWRAIGATDAVKRGFTVMQMVQLLTRANWPNWPQQLAGVLLLVAPVLARSSRWREWEFRRLYLCSVLVFCLIFNHMAESPTFVVASAGVGIWFAALARRTRGDWALFAFLVVFTFLASSDAMPVVVQREFFDRYSFKAVPLIVLWIELQRRLWSGAPPLADGTAGSRIAADVAETAG
jgi:hypothetical protein